MYRIIGTDQKEYGPVTAEQIHQWIAEGRIDARTKVLLVGVDAWKNAAEFPEFSMALAARYPAGQVAFVPVAPPAAGRKTNAMAVWSMATGIASLACCLQFLGPLPIVLGIVSYLHIKRNPQEQGIGFSITGIVLGSIAFAVFIIAVLLLIISPDLSGSFQNMMNQLNQ